MTYIKINDVQYPATINGRVTDKDWDNRESKSITLEMTHEDAKSIFVDDLAWSIVYQPDSYKDEKGEIVVPEAEVYDNSEFVLAGDIIDHRDGTITVKMGKLTALEEAYEIMLGGAE
jgi:hypothetical protein